MSKYPIYGTLIPITPESIAWAEQHYPYYHRPFGSKRRQRSYLLGRALLHHQLEQMLSLTLDHPLKMLHGPHGKPALAHHPASFNLTHSTEWVALLLTRKPDSLLGIDLERIDPQRAFDKLLLRTFSKSERQWIAEAPSFLEAFYALWSAKEAYLKAHGGGLSALSKLTLHPPSHQTPNIQGICDGPLNGGVLSIHTPIANNSFALYYPQEGQLILTEGNIQTNREGLHLAMKPLTPTWSYHLYDR